MTDYNFYEAGNFQAGPILPELKPEEGYVPSKELQEAVNVAIMLQKPLLLTGKPGTGKTALAYHLAEKFGLGDVISFATRTDSTASDLLYRYDSLAHFQRVNIYKENAGLDAATIEENFIEYEGLGKAICDSIGYNKDKKPRKRVVLIDEIDKAPRDLPNDILTTLEKMEFKVPELKTAPNTTEAHWYKKDRSEDEQQKAQYRPLVIMTSNSEKTLPEAFLRRCVFFYIKFPEEEELIEILRNKKSIFKEEDQQHFEPLVKLFNQMREDASLKKPATHELVLWVWWMLKNGLSAEDIYHYKDLESPKKESLLLSGISILAKETEDWTRIRNNITNAVYQMG